MNTEKCKIKLDSPENVYYSGQQIKGQICIVLTKKTKIRGIYMKLYGYGKCSWIEFMRRESQITPTEKETQRSMVYSSKEEYLNYKTYIVGSKSSKGMELEPGPHSYEFSYNLVKNLPSTFKGSYGSIKYKMEFTVEKAWNFDDKYTISLIIVNSRPLSIFNVYSAPILQQLTKHIGVFGSGPISLVAELPCDSVVRGKKLILRVTVDNKSSTHVEKLKFSIRQIVTYFSQQPLPSVKREEVIKIFKKETGGIEKKSDRTFEHELQIPACQPSDDTFSRIIFIRYDVQVDVVLPGLYKNLTVNLPLIICSHEPDRSQPMASSSSDNNPYPIGWATIYPSLNTSLTSIASYANSSISNYAPSIDSPTLAHEVRNNSSASLQTIGRTSIASYANSSISNYAPSIDSPTLAHEVRNNSSASLQTMGRIQGSSPAHSTSLYMPVQSLFNSSEYDTPPPGHPDIFETSSNSMTNSSGSSSRSPSYNMTNNSLPSFEQVASYNSRNSFIDSPRSSFPSSSSSITNSTSPGYNTPHMRTPREMISSTPGPSSRHSHYSCDPPPPSYSELFGNTPPIPENMATAPPLDIVYNK